MDYPRIGYEAHAPKQELWQGQQEALAAIRDAHERGVTSGYVVMATGTGKTRVAAEDVARTMREGNTKRTLFLCHNKEILRQAHGEFDTTLGHDSTHGYMFGGEFEDQEDVVYATFQTMTRKLGGGKVYEGFDRDEFDYVVIDETHHAPAVTYSPVVEYFQPKFMLGLTPTPNRRDGQSIQNIVGEKFFSLPLERAIAEGYVTPVNYKILTDRIKTVQQLKQEGVELDINKIDEQIFIPKTDQEISESIKGELSQIENPRTIVFCSNIASAEKFAETYSGQVLPIHSMLDDKKVQERIKMFRKGEIPMVATVGMLDEGIDLPEINSVVFLRQTESEAVWLQQLGRGLRKSEDKDEVLVLDYVASFARLSRIHKLIGDVKSHYTPPDKDDNDRIAETDSFMSKYAVSSFRFNMSDEALRCQEIIQVARNKAKPKLPEVEEIESDTVQAVRKRFNIPNADSKLTGKFTEFKEWQWESVRRRIQNGDTRLQQEVLEACMPKMLNLAKNYVEQNGLTVEDHFMAAYRGYLEGSVIKSRDSQTYLSIMNAEGRKIIVGQIVANTLVKGSISLSDQGGTSAKAEVFVDPTQPETLDHVRDRDDATEQLPFELAKEATDAGNLRKGLSTLSERDRKVMEMRWGLNGGSYMTLDEVSQVMGLTREGVRQIEHRSFKKLKIAPDVAHLWEERDPLERNFGREQETYHYHESTGWLVDNAKHQELQAQDYVLHRAVSIYANAAFDGLLGNKDCLVKIVLGLIAKDPSLRNDQRAIQRELAYMFPYGARLKQHVPEVMAEIVKRTKLTNPTTNI